MLVKTGKGPVQLALHLAAAMSTSFVTTDMVRKSMELHNDFTRTGQNTPEMVVRKRDRSGRGIGTVLTDLAINVVPRATRQSAGKFLVHTTGQILRHGYHHTFSKLPLLNRYRTSASSSSQPKKVAQHPLISHSWVSPESVVDKDVRTEEEVAQHAAFTNEEIYMAVYFDEKLIYFVSCAWFMVRAMTLYMVALQTGKLSRRAIVFMIQRLIKEELLIPNTKSVLRPKAMDDGAIVSNRFLSLKEDDLDLRRGV